MRRDSKNNPFEAKRIARQKYAERQIDKWWQWSWEENNACYFVSTNKDESPLILSKNI
jgi:hypothetical protein